MNERTDSGSQFLAPGINPGWHKQKKNLLKGCRVVLRINIKTKIIQPHKWAATKGSQAGGTMAESVAQEYLLRTPLWHPRHQTPVSSALPPLAVSCGPSGLQWRCPPCESDLTDLWPELPLRASSPRQEWTRGCLAEPTLIARKGESVNICPPSAEGAMLPPIWEFLPKEDSHVMLCSLKMLYVYYGRAGEKKLRTRESIFSFTTFNYNKC